MTILLFSCGKNGEGIISHSEMILIPGGQFMMGSPDSISFQDEYPPHKVKITAFLMDKYEVTNRQFLEFVSSTGYVTTAERIFKYVDVLTGDSISKKGSLIFDASDIINDSSARFLNWWKWREDANWRQPYGPESSISDIMDHPVIHVSWYDANAYAKWSNKRLPTESEWEWAARGGKDNTQYPWGNSEPNRSYHKANLWQGIFPLYNENKDGSEWSSKVGAYLPNGYGLHDMAGNVWEWCLDEYDQNAYKKKLDQKKIRDAHFWKSHRNENDPNIEKVMRGGSFLCDESICSGYNLTRRMRSTPDTGFIHTGFRCIKEVR